MNLSQLPLRYLVITWYNMHNCHAKKTIYLRYRWTELLNKDYDERDAYRVREYVTLLTACRNIQEKYFRRRNVKVGPPNFPEAPCQSSAAVSK